jgi:hypothetical protein
MMNQKGNIDRGKRELDTFLSLYHRHHQLQKFKEPSSNHPKSEACQDLKHTQEDSAHGNSTSLRDNEVGKNAKRTPDWLQRAVLSKFLIAPIMPRI